MSRLLVMTENYRPGGGNRWMIDVANAIAPAFESTVLASNPGGLFESDLARLELPAQVVDVPANTVAGMREGGASRPARMIGRLAEPILFSRTVRAGRDAIRNHAPDLVIACAGGYPAARAPLAWTIAAHAEGVPCVLTVVGTPTPRPDGLVGAYEARMDRSMDERVWASASLVVANAQSILSLLTERRGMPPTLGACVHNGLPDTEARVSHTATGSPVTVGLVSRIDSEKGVFILLDAFERVLARHPETRLVLAGTGTELSRLRERIIARGLGHAVETPGSVPGAIDELVASFDIYAMPSLQEGFPYSMIEAMRAGCAIAITDVGGVAEVLESERDALLVPPGDAAAMEGALERLVSDAALRKSLGDAGRVRFESECTLEAMAEGLRSAFSEAGLLPAD